MSMTHKRYLALALAVLLSGCDQSGSTANSTLPAAVTKETKGASVTLKSIEVNKEIGSYGIVPTAPAGATYVVAVYTLKNTSSDALPFVEWPQARLVDAAGHKFEPEIMSSTALSAAANASWAETLNPNLATDITQVWKVDEKSFDRKTWTIEFQSKPKLTFPLQ
jgi:uncharacterized lipoprotein YmbA